MPVPPPGAPPHRADTPAAPTALRAAAAPTASRVVPAPRAGRTAASDEDRAFWRGETTWRGGELLTPEPGGGELLERARHRLERPLAALAARSGAWAGAPVRWAATAVAGAALTAFAVLIVSGRVVTEGPVVLGLTATHGVHAGDLAVLVVWAAAEAALVAAALHGGATGAAALRAPTAAALATETPATAAGAGATSTVTISAVAGPAATGAAAPGAPAAGSAATGPVPPPVRDRSWAARTAPSGDRPLRRDVDPDALREELGVAAAGAPSTPATTRAPAPGEEQLVAVAPALRATAAGRV